MSEQTQSIPQSATSTAEPTVPKVETPTVTNGATDVENEQVSLRVVGQDGGEVLFRLKRKTPLSKLMDSYCQRMGISRAGIRFLFDGQRVHDDATPITLGLQDHDILDAVLQQVGGVQVHGFLSG